MLFQVVLQGILECRNWVRGGWTRSCDSLRDYEAVWILYGAAYTKTVWFSFGEVLLSTHTKRILLESACEALSGKRVNPIQPLRSCALNYLAVGKAGVPTWIRLTNSKMLPF